jgi:nicotinate-nucleotide pyrophosphorylase (carboxylating)
MNPVKLDFDRINTLIELAIEEDVGNCDATSLSVIGRGVAAEAELICREECVCAGLPAAAAVFKKLDAKVKFVPLAAEGELCQPNTILAKIAGDAASMLTAERTALNFLQRLCGIAALSRKYAAAVKGTKTKILDTRKTTPGWRNLEKYAVSVGGAENHRIGLYDRIMIKDNHRELAGLLSEEGIAESVRRARKMYPKLEIEIEADTIDDVRKALSAGADYILLDNMSDETMKEAVKIVAGKTKLEASGGVTFERLAKIAKIGVDFISCGALTHSVRAIDISMEIKKGKKK